MTALGRNNETVALPLKIEIDTENAVFVSADGNRSSAVWLPKSSCDFEGPIVYGRAQIIIVENWIAKKRGLI